MTALATIRIPAVYALVDGLKRRVAARLQPAGAGAPTPVREAAAGATD